MNEWQPIETAPKDATPILLFINGNPKRGFLIQTGSYLKKDNWEGWVDSYECEDLAPPTHWMPLPEPPIEGE